MQRLKVSWLFAVMMLAVAAWPAAASADGFYASGYPATVEGESTTSEYIVLPSASIELECVGQELSGTLAEGSQTLALNANGSKCNSTPVQMNGCRFELHPQTNRFHVGPAGCGPIKIGLGSCAVSIPPQNDLAATYTNEGNGNSVKVAPNVSGLTYTVEGGYLCNNKKGTYSNGGYTGSWSLQANGGKKLWTGPIPTGVYVAGKESGNPAEQPRVEAEKYDASLLGKQSEPSGLSYGLAGFSANCTTAQFEKQLIQAAADLSVRSTFSGCSAFGLSTTVKMNSCWYEFHVTNVGPPYAATVDIDCAVPGDGIEYDSVACGSKIPAQSGLSGITVTNTGEGVGRGMEMKFNVKDIQYSVTDKMQYFCPLSGSGSYSNGTLTGTVNWSAVR